LSLEVDIELSHKSESKVKGYSVTMCLAWSNIAVADYTSI